MQELASHGFDIVFRLVPLGEEVEQRVLPRDAIVPAARVAFDAKPYDTVRVTFGEERVEEDASFSEHDIEGGSVLKVEVVEKMLLSSLTQCSCTLLSVGVTHHKLPPRSARS